MCMCGIACSHKSVGDIFNVFLKMCCHHTKVSQQLGRLGLPSPTCMGSTELVRSTDSKRTQVPWNRKELGTTRGGATVLSSAVSRWPINAEAMECPWGLGGNKAQDLTGANQEGQNWKLTEVLVSCPYLEVMRWFALNLEHQYLQNIRPSLSTLSLP